MIGRDLRPAAQASSSFFLAFLAALASRLLACSSAFMPSKRDLLSAAKPKAEPKPSEAKPAEGGKSNWGVACAL